jgi:hypothetical protein
MEEAGSSSARARKPYTLASPKLADSSDTHHGEAGLFSSTRRKKRSTRIEVSTDDSNDDPGRRVVLVDLVSSGDDSSNNSGDNSGNNSGDDSDDHEASSETIMHEICLGPSHCNTPCFCSVVICANDHLNTSLITLEESKVDPWSKP